MKRSLSSGIVVSLFFVFFGSTVAAVQPKLPPGTPPGLYDEEKVPKYTLPDPLVLLNGDKVNDVNTWNQKRRQEILNLFAENVYGKTMVARPADMSWKVISENRSALDGNAITKTVEIYFSAKADGPKMEVNFILPASAGKKPVPIFLVPGWGLRNPQLLLNRGYGIANFNPNQIEPDKRGGYENSIRK
ncbi:MAG: hypothetical protein ABSH16_13595, partial [Sedimentisphaerales bacterium]